MAHGLTGVTQPCTCGHERYLHYNDERNGAKVERCDNCACMNFTRPPHKHCGSCMTDLCGEE